MYNIGILLVLMALFMILLVFEKLLVDSKIEENDTEMRSHNRYKFTAELEEEIRNKE